MAREALIAILYHWRLAEGRRADFEEAWSAITAALKLQGALGSTLFDAPDDTVYALARWPDRETRAASSARSADPVRYDVMISCIVEEWPEVILNEAINLWDGFGDYRGG